MLDFYGTNQNDLSDDHNLSQPISSFSMQESRALSCIVLHESLIGRIFHYYEDHSLSPRQVEQLLEICINCFHKIDSTDSFVEITYEKVITMLNGVVSNKLGLKSVCD
jgi:hypothetical protein